MSEKSPKEKNQIPKKPVDSRPYLERILSPENLQKMMAASGLLLVLGIAAWLWSVGVFENPITLVATCVSVNLGVIALGCFLILLTRFHLAGTGLTLLGCLALPLNLWLLHSSGLMSMHNDAPLWIPSAFICLIYGLIAKVLKDRKLVYVIAGGTILTGCLLIASPMINGFFNPLSHVLFLMVSGWAFTLGTLLFPEAKGEFSRENFGDACFRSGTVILGLATSGLAGLIVSSFASNYSPWFAPAVTATTPVLMAGLVGSIAACFVSQKLLQNSRTFLFLAVSQFALLLLVSIQHFELSFNLFGLATLTAAALSGIHLTLLFWKKPRNPVAVLIPTVLTILLQVFGVFQFICFLTSTFTEIACGWNAGWNAVGLFLIAFSAASCGALLSKRRQPNAESAITLLGLTGSIVATLASVCMVSILPFQLDYTLPIIALPVAFSSAVILHRHNNLAVTGYSAATIGSLLALSICYVTIPSWSSSLLPLNFPLAWTLGYVAAGSTVFSAATFFASSVNARLSIASMIYSLIAIASGLGHFGADLEFIFILPFTLVGLGWKLYQIALKNDGDQPASFLQKNAASAVLNFGFVCTLLFSLSLVASPAPSIPFSILALYTIQTSAAALQAYFSRTSKISGLFKANFAIQLFCTLVVTTGFLQLEPGYIAETLVIGLGVFLVAAGHWVWLSKPEEKRNDASAMNMIGCGILTVVSLATLLAHRWTHYGDLSRWVHEIMALGLGVGLLQLGTFFKFRSTTLSGMTLLVVYILSLAMYIPVPKELENASVLMIVIGGTVFGLAIFLSIYRDWVLSIPKKIKKGEGAFQFMNWKI